MAASRAKLEPVSALIIAGGRGTRFWPAARQTRPKPLFSFDGVTTLLGDTIARLSAVIPQKRIFVMVSAEHRGPFRRAIAGVIPAENLIVEPAARGTGVAIAYGAAEIARRAGNGIVAVMPADHYIEPAAAFARTLKKAIQLARSHESIVVIGVPPSRPETGYGYQLVGRAVGDGFKVAQFVEKPDLARARAMIKSGRYLWNAGMFVMSHRVLARATAAHAPALKRAIERLVAAPRSKFAAYYRALKFGSFDKEVVEKSASVVGVRAQFGWHDVGSWSGLWEALGRGQSSVTRGNVIVLESRRVLAHSDSRLMVLLGVDDIVAVDTGDAILIARRDRSQHVGRVSDELRRRGMTKYL
jgi:mannose-1-phosphate guanylyltransferase